MIVLCAGEKGGAGKTTTTTATNLAALRSKNGKDVLFVDTDIQETANYWSHLRNDVMDNKITTIQKYGNVKKEILSLKNKFDDIIIDAGGRDTLEFNGPSLNHSHVLRPWFV